MNDVHPRLNRRQVLKVGASAALAALAPPGQAQGTYPERAVQFIVPTTVGGGADLLARMFSQKFAEATGQQAVIVNVPGAGGIIGVQKVTTAKPDGYTVLFGFNQLTTMNPSLIPQLAYDVNRDLMPVTMLAEQAYVWIANNAFEPSTLTAWIDATKPGRDRVTFAHNGAGSAANLAAEMFMQMTGGNMLGVPYKNNATPDLLANVVQLKMEPASVALPLIKAGSVKALAVTSATRLSALPQVPAMAELFPGYLFSATYSLWVPSGTPPPLVARLHHEFVQIVRAPVFSERLAATSIKPIGGTPAELLADTQKEYQALSRLVKLRNIKVES